MPKGRTTELPTGIKPKMRTKDGKTMPIVTEDGTPVYRVRVRDAALGGKQVERVVEGWKRPRRRSWPRTTARRTKLPEGAETDGDPRGSGPRGSSRVGRCLWLISLTEVHQPDLSPVALTI
jgi:hypothetical protein